MTLRDIVFRELDTATDDNGYTLDLLTAEELAGDLVSYSAAVDGPDPEELVPYVQESLQQTRVG